MADSTEADAVREQLRRHGAARAAARAKARREMAAIEQLAPKAVELGIPKIEVAALAEISRPALDDLLRS